MKRVGVSIAATERAVFIIGLIRTMAYTHIPANLFFIAAALMPTLGLTILFLLLRASVSSMDVPARQAYVMAVVPVEERPAAASITNVPRSLDQARIALLYAIELVRANSRTAVTSLASGDPPSDWLWRCTMIARWLIMSSLALTAVTLPTVSHADEKGEHEKNEKAVALNDIPAPARDTIVREAKGSKIKEVEQETRNEATVYEAHIQKGDKEIGVVVDANGKLLGKHDEEKENE